MRFADTSFWIALQFARDQWHDPARELWTAERDRVLTTYLIIGETWTFLRRRVGHSPAVRFLDDVDRSPRVTVAPMDDSIEQDAWRWLRRHDERPYSFVDSTSFAIMRRTRLREALAFDGDFSAAGFVEVRP